MQLQVVLWKLEVSYVIYKFLQNLLLQSFPLQFLSLISGQINDYWTNSAALTRDKILYMDKVDKIL
jgi:hypothetical protein